MKKFKYRLDSYLKFQIFERDKALADLLRAQEILDGFVRELSSVIDKIKNGYACSSQSHGSKSNLLMAQDSQLFLRRLFLEKENIEQEIHLAEREVERRQEKVLEFRLKVKSLETHKEKEVKKFKREKDKKEQKRLDDINQTRHEKKYAESI